MELIRQNPYHVIGILAGANQRTTAKQRAKINAFQKVGKNIEFDTDLEFIGIPDRSNSDLENAFSNIEINQNKLFNALFWFVNHNHLDETALTYLQSGDLEKAEDIWQKVIHEKDVSSRTFSAFNNLGTLKLTSAYLNETVDHKSLIEGIRLKVELLVSENFKTFSDLVADETYTVDTNRELNEFIESILNEIDGLNRDDSVKVKRLLINSHPRVESIVIDKLTSPHLQNIERKVLQTAKIRNTNPENGQEIARKFYKSFRKDLNVLKEYLSATDLKFQITTDKVSKELLQCGIDYFIENKELKDVEIEKLCEDVLKIFKTAEGIAIGAQLKERIRENITGVSEYLKRAPVKEELDYITQKLEECQDLPEDILLVNYWVVSCKPKLKRIKNVLGSSDELYLSLSTAVAANVQRILVTAVNNAQENNTNPMFRIAETKGVFSLTRVIQEALKVSFILGRFDMENEFHSHFLLNHTALLNIARQMNLSTLSPAERIRQRIKNLKQQLEDAECKTFLDKEITSAQREMERIHEWQLFRSKAKKEYQVSEQQRKIYSIRAKSEMLKREKIGELEVKISKLERELNKIE